MMRLMFGMSRRGRVALTVTIMIVILMRRSAAADRVLFASVRERMSASFGLVLASAVVVVI